MQKRTKESCAEGENAKVSVAIWIGTMYALAERLWERSKEGRKETNRRQSTENGKRSMGNQADRNGKRWKAERSKSQPESYCEAKRWRTGNEETEAE